MNRAILKPTTIITTPSGGFGKGSYEDRRAWTPVARPVWPKLLADRDLNHDRMILRAAGMKGGLLGTFGTAVVGGLAAYLVAYFYENPKASLSETYRRLRLVR